MPIIHQIVREAVFVYIIKVRLRWDQSMFIIYKNAHFWNFNRVIHVISCNFKSCNFISFYRSPSQFSGSFEEFADNLQLSLDKISNQNPFLTVALSDFNTKSSNWYKHNRTTYEGSKIDAVTSQFGLQQLIKEPSHILGNSSSCIDLIFTSHPSLQSWS